MLKKLPVLLGLAMAALLMLAALHWHVDRGIAALGATERVSVDSAGNQGDGDSGPAAISADGRYVAFESYATNLVLGDTNDSADVFVHDRQTGTTELVSVDGGGIQGNGDSFVAAISADGRYVAFESDATNLVAVDTNSKTDVFVRDRTSSTTERVSVDGGGIQGNGDSDGAAISADGRYVAFYSYATNLVLGDSNSKTDVFVRDRTSSTTERVSVASGGTQGDGDSFSPAISADGRYVAFESSATNLVLGDSNSKSDVFVRDRQSSTTERVSVASGGTPGDGDSGGADISGDGRYVAFESSATNLTSGDTNGSLDAFVRDRTSSTTERVSVASGGAQGNGDSYYAAISADGRDVAFQSAATNLVAGDTNVALDVFVHDRQSSTTERVSVASGGIQGNDDSNIPAISADGRYAAFESLATNLVPVDTNGNYDVFVHDRGVAATPTPTATASPTPTAIHTATVTATPTPTSTATPTPTGSPGGLIQGDVDCNDTVDAVDAVKLLRHVGGLPVSQTPPCPDIGSDVHGHPFGDVDCDGDVTSVDALQDLRFVGGLPVNQNPPCAQIGSALT